MLQTRPSSASGHLQATAQSQRSSQMARNIYSTGHITNTYRGQSTPALVAYTSASNPNPLRQHPASPHLRLENRTSSVPTTPFIQPGPLNNLTNQGRILTPTQVSSALMVTSNAVPVVRARDDSYVPTPRTVIATAPRPMSAMELTLPLPDAAKALAGPQPKPSPDRYRRNQRRAETSQSAFHATAIGGSAVPSGSGMATVGHLYSHVAQAASAPALSSQQTYRGSNMTGLQRIVDARLPRTDDPSSPEQAKRYRRRSSTNPEAPVNPSTLESRALAPPVPSQRTWASVASTPYVPPKSENRPLTSVSKPSSAHGRNGSDESASSTRSSSRPASVMIPSCLTSSLDANIFVGQARCTQPSDRGQPHQCSRSDHHQT